LLGENAEVAYFSSLCLLVVSLRDVRARSLDRSEMLAAGQLVTPGAAAEFPAATIEAQSAMRRIRHVLGGGGR
jgi:hypothetical protein